MRRTDLKISNWIAANMQVFWREIAQRDALVQIYENETHFLNTLEGFAGSGILSGDCVVIIASRPYLEKLHERLLKHKFDIEVLLQKNLYIPLDASEALTKLMVNHQPDEKLFNSYIFNLLDLAKSNGRKVRAFSEMAAILWEKGEKDATVKLVNLWHKLHCADEFTLYSAYPKSAFNQQNEDFLSAIFKAHSKIIDGQNRPSTEIHYRAL